MDFQPHAMIRTTWSDDSVTISEPMTMWYANWVLFTYGFEEFWKNEIRPIRASLVKIHMWPEQLSLEM